MRITATILVVALTAGCAQPDYRIADARDALDGGPQTETLREEIQREAHNGCLSAGTGIDSACRDTREGLADVIAPPEYPEGVTPPTRVGPVPPLPAPPPPPPAPPSRDD
ncbi:hypothetical protein [Aurantiacibacter gangjinensis]|uniref:Uncharacterized protein n=1 Tax=Aurantiacibacter gangjinensis TaxID=502682 RepID=A0A0G9MS10_9SPHN|nr:hypothetical protein [Aurantiacibacter gangjinensis]APE27125.1 hypothetical protein BMF35_a0296 [Aurantiacibacter gangjinensis]KLE33536.1 hypothetical protein AAW01_06470 [Aurantiacibacter gangjinensis]